MKLDLRTIVGVMSAVTCDICGVLAHDYVLSECGHIGPRSRICRECHKLLVAVEWPKKPISRGAAALIGLTVSTISAARVAGFFGVAEAQYRLLCEEIRLAAPEIEIRMPDISVFPAEIDAAMKLIEKILAAHDMCFPKE